MKFHIVTLFPKVVENYLDNAGIVARAFNEKLLEYETYFLRDYSNDKHDRVDDTPFGGGPGMVMKCESLFNVVEHIFEKVGAEVPVVNFAPGAEPLDQKITSQWSLGKFGDDVILVCARYEGIDQRFIEKYVTHQYSVGESILAGAELPALCFIESITRLIPGVLNNTESPFDHERSYPVYTRPEDFQGMKVPEVLLSGNHAKIEKWRRENEK